MLTRCFMLVSLLQFATSYMMFQMRIPNGNSIPHPCKPDEIWHGVGHILPEGTGTRNPFGRDFEASGYVWTVDLCRKDSDGDGIYNGMELGDPDCVWKVDDMPKTREGISHPGICDPWDSMVCGNKKIISPIYNTQQAWMKEKCHSGSFKCAAMSDKDLKNATVRLPAGTRLPAEMTTYECQIFDIYAHGVPRDKDFHMVAVTPVIDNKEVVHHIVLFGCAGNAVPTPEGFECGMKPSDNCQEVLHVWTVGLPGECYHPESGVRIGQTGYKFLAIQLHWNNAMQRRDLTDSSGLVFHYTPNMKHYDAGVFVLGSALFYLPPNHERVIVNSTCAPGCTKQLLRGPIHITSAWNHMHYAGKTMVIEVKRYNEHRAFLTYDRVYDYDSPQVQMFTNPVEILPGDSIDTQCGFTTQGRNKTINWGDATLDEMCFGFITYYPKENLTTPYCLDKLGVSMCQPESLGGCVSLGKFLKMINVTEAFIEVTNNCNELAPCLQECRDTIIKLMKTEPCMRGQIWEFIQYQLSMMTGPPHAFLCRLASCKAEVQMAMQSQSAMSYGSNGAPETVTRSFLTFKVFIFIILQLCRN